MEYNNSVISKQKITHTLAKYIWDSPILKSLVYNPFILSFCMLIIIWLLDFIYGKTFKCNKSAIIAQHMITTYIILACSFAMNNIIIKHNYRIKMHKKCDDVNDNIDYTHEQQSIRMV